MPILRNVKLQKNQYYIIRLYYIKLQTIENGSIIHVSWAFYGEKAVGMV